MKQSRVLVVDDEQQNLDLLVRVLHREFEVFTASSGTEALDIIARNDVDVIVSDQRMPGMLGTELLREAAARCPAAKRILLTAYAHTGALVATLHGAAHLV